MQLNILKQCCCTPFLQRVWHRHKFTSLVVHVWLCWGPVTADKCYRSIFQFFTKYVKTGRSSLTSSCWCIVPHSNTVGFCFFLLNWLFQAIDRDYNLYVDMSKEILIPDEVDIVLGFMYVGGGSGLSRIAPEGQWQDSRRQWILRIICESYSLSHSSRWQILKQGLVVMTQTK